MAVRYIIATKDKMTVENDAINWETIQEASRIAAGAAMRKFSFPVSEFDEIQNECILFILADTSRSRKLKRYSHGDKTAEKVNKLIYSLNTDRSWLGGVYSNEGDASKYAAMTSVLLDTVTAKDIVRQVFSGDTVMSEELALVSDKLMRTLSKSHREILTAVYSNPSVSKKQVALDHGLGWRHVYKIITKAVAIAEREWIPVFCCDQPTREMPWYQ